MLELRPRCERCDKDLPPSAPDAMICTFWVASVDAPDHQPLDHKPDQGREHRRQRESEIAAERQELPCAKLMTFERLRMSERPSAIRM